MTDEDTTAANEASEDKELPGRFEIFIDWAVRGSEALRPFVRVDEDMFIRVHGQAAADVRAYWLYAALDECQKAGMHLMRLQELLSGSEVAPLTDRPSRVLIQSIIEEERLRERRLVELLTTLVLFTTTNDQVYYRHLLMLEELDALLRANEDQEEFHGARSGNIDQSISNQVASLQRVQNEVDFARAWYLADDVTPIPAVTTAPKRLLSKHVRFSSMRQRLKRSILLMTPSEKLCTGVTYADAYGAPSSAIHFGVDTKPYLLHSGQDGALATKIGLILAAALNRTHELLGRPECPLITQLSRVLERSDQENGKSMVEQLTNRGLEVGDFVLANGYLAEILAIRESKYASRSYRILYLAERPMPDLFEDWLPARYVQPFHTRERAAQGLASIWEKHSWPKEDLNTIQADAARFQEAMRHSIKELWPMLRAAMWARTAQAEPDDSQQTP